MDFEAVQLLNLSPIPELSEIELSTMLEQLSNLSDLNGDLTDRNVEDILREAEDLLDKSASSRYTEIKISNQSVVSAPEKKEVVEKESENNITEIDDSDGFLKKELPNDDANCDNLEKQSVESVEKQSENNEIKIFSPRSPANHIRSTIDSLREISSLMEKHISSQSQDSSPKSSKDLENKKNYCKISIDLKAKNDVENVMETPRSLKSPGKKKKVEPLDMNKSIQLLNCFERLYQNRPTSKKVKTTDKVVTKKKHSKDIKSSVVNKEKKQNNKKAVVSRIGDNFASKLRQGLPNKKDERDIEDWIKQTNRAGVTYLTQYKMSLPYEKLSQEESESDSFVRQIRQNSLATGDHLLLKLLQDMEEIKNQVKNSGMSYTNQHSEMLSKESQAVIDKLRSEVESVRQKVTSEENENAAIRRLEEQFSMLKDKYDRQMEKLESENLKLKEALQNRQKTMQPLIEKTDEIPVPLSGNQTNHSTPKKLTPSPQKLISRSTSYENCRTPSNSPQPPTSPEDNLTCTLREPAKEACSQTEKELKNTSTQCCEDEEEKQESIYRVENKENVSQKKKTIKSKPFSDVYQFVRQRKTISEHETQLLATLRGLQGELSEKNKEIRKLKNESELLKNQIRRIGKSKPEYLKKLSTVGTQTIGLGPAVQMPYNPQIFEVPNEYQKENEELKARVRTLEENFELLKEKRVTDLQSLHKVHEEEMSKLVSKLETQSALTKHLHALLVNR